jgi:hypothetical protein
MKKVIKLNERPRLAGKSNKMPSVFVRTLCSSKPTLFQCRDDPVLLCLRVGYEFESSACLKANISDVCLGCIMVATEGNLNVTVEILNKNSVKPD